MHTGLNTFGVSSTTRRTISSSYPKTLREGETRKLIGTIRQQPGFERFLSGPSETELKGLAGPDSIVVFNVPELRSDAFLITNRDIRCLQLPELTYEILEEYTKKFLNVMSKISSVRHRAAARQEMHKILEWLSDVAVGPILDELGLTQKPSDHDVFPRVWWVGIRLLKIFPIHAAGYHELAKSRIKMQAKSRSRSLKLYICGCWEETIVNWIPAVRQKRLAFSFPVFHSFSHLILAID